MLSMRRYHLRPYVATDRAACLRLFRSNIPDSFRDEEVTGFLDFIDRLPGQYLVCEESASGIVACGGLACEAGTVTLCWGIVEKAHQGKGIGRLLLRARLAIAAELDGAERIVMNTSQHTAGFFEKEGLRTVKVQENYYASGLHRHDMELALDEAARRRIMSVSASDSA